MGMIVWEGESRINGSPIVAILTGENGSRKTANGKIGDLVQLWILHRDLSPSVAKRTGEDEANCGDCPIKKQCYVNVAFAPTSVHKAYKAGSYRHATSEELRAALSGRKLRLGAYGDPAALPIEVIEDLVDKAAGHVGYTQRWRHAGNKPYSRYLMASVKSESGAKAAWRAGWRTYRVRNDGDVKLGGEITCPASSEAGKRLQCSDCMACDGKDRHGKASVTIILHGGLKAINKVTRI